MEALLFTVDLFYICFSQSRFRIPFLRVRDTSTVVFCIARSSSNFLSGKLQILVGEKSSVRGYFAMFHTFVSFVRYSPQGQPAKNNAPGIGYFCTVNHSFFPVIPSMSTGSTGQGCIHTQWYSTYRTQANQPAKEHHTTNPICQCRGR